jgi:magnesium transporter
MKIYSIQEGKLSDNASLDTALNQCHWIDLFSPSTEEKKLVESHLGVKIPTREEMHEIEPSARLYKENDALFMTVNTVKKEGESTYSRVHITFILKQNTLVTLRYNDIAPITSFLQIVTNKPSFPIDSALSLFLGMLETIVYALADTIENLSATLEHFSQKIFHEKQRKKHDLPRLFISMGLVGENNSKVRISLASINMMLGFLKANITFEDKKRFESRLEHLSVDTADLKEHSAFFESRISFNLDACIGSIHIEQNNIIKIFSVAAVVLLPPTLIASIYGMNFTHMPEINWHYGYPFALILMVLFAIVPYLFFKKKGWL